MTESETAGPLRPSQHNKFVAFLDRELPRLDLEHRYDPPFHGIYKGRNFLVAEILAEPDPPANCGIDSGTLFIQVKEPGSRAKLVKLVRKFNRADFGLKAKIIG